MSTNNIPIRPRKLRRLLALAAFGAILAGTGIGTGIAHASPETDYLTDLNGVGMTIYNTQQAINTGYAICSALNTTTGDVVAENLFTHTTWADVPDRATAQRWVAVAAVDLCPSTIHNNTQSGYVA